MDVLHPIIYKAITSIPYIVGLILLILIMSVFAVDCGLTVATILKFNKRLKIMDEMAAKIHKLSDEIGVNIYENVTDVIEKSEEFQENHAELLDKLSDTKDELMDIPGNAKEKLSETAATARLAINENIMEAKSSIEARTMAITEKTAEWKRNQEAKKQEREKLILDYNNLFSKKDFGIQRLLKAFPDMRSRSQNEQLDKLKEYFQINKKNQ